MNIVSILDRGPGTSRYHVTVFGADNIMIGLGTRAKVNAWIAARAPGAFMVAPDVMREAMDHYYSARKVAQ